MKTNLHLVFGGECTEAFAFYEKVFKSKIEMTMKYGDAPPDAPVPEGAKDLVMHTSMPLGSMLLMGCDAPPAMRGGSPMESPIAGSHISIDMEDADEVKRLFAELSDSGSVQMPLTPTFWTPLFGMCTDKFGVGWMVSVPGPQMA